MSNSMAMQSLNPLMDEVLGQEEVKKCNPPVQNSTLKVVPRVPSEPPTLEMLIKMYASQERECWLCEGVAKKVAETKDLSEDDSWHFTSCVLSWEYLHNNNE